MKTWKDFEKNSQVWGYYAPAHGSPSSELEGLKAVANGVGKGLSAAGGALIGAFQQYGDAVGRGALPAPDMDKSWIDLSVRDTGNAAAAAEQVASGARTGAQVGWRDADRVASDAAVTAARTANRFGLYGDKKVLALQRENDRKILEQIERANAGDGYKFPVPRNKPTDENGLLVPVTDENGNEIPEYAEYNNYIKWARGGQGVAEGALTTAATIAGTRALGRFGRFVDSKISGPARPAPRISFGKSLPAAPGAALAASEFRGGYDKAKEQDKSRDLEKFNYLVEDLKNRDPSSEEYREIYQEMKKDRDVNPNAFDAIEPPRSPEYHPAPAKPAPSPSAQSTPRNGWYLSPEAQNLIGYGLGGAFLGGLFGGKGGWWKLALLGILLGALRNGGQLKGIWNNVTGATGTK